MLKKLFGKKEKIQEETLFAPLQGQVVKIEDVPDPVFAEKMMGDGIAIDPSDGEVVSPVNGEIVQVFPTKHAIGIKSEAGLEVLVHIGLDTVQMNGEGFTSHISVGDKVQVGTKLVSFDLELVREKAKSTITPIIITNSEVVKNVDKTTATQSVRTETDLLHVSLV
jgi:sugar PTS system EIIA component